METGRLGPASGPELWLASLDLSEDALSHAKRVLSSAERQRADRFLSSRDGDRFVAARACLRRILAGLVGGEPEEIDLEESPQGKPAIRGSSLHLSASRSGDMALFATSWTMEVGVDIEAIRKDDPWDVDAISSRFFTPAENRALGAMDVESRLQASFQCWTCKEAYVKGTGEGIGASLSKLEVWSPTGDAMVIGEWRVCPVTVCRGFAAAVAGRSRESWSPGRPHFVS